MVGGEAYGLKIRKRKGRGVRKELSLHSPAPTAFSFFKLGVDAHEYSVCDTPTYNLPAFISPPEVSSTPLHKAPYWASDSQED